MKERKKRSAPARRETLADSRPVEHDAPTTAGPEAQEQIRMRAYELYRERGGKVGDDMADWLQAEREYFERQRVHDDMKPNPPRTTTGGWFTAPKFGSAGSGGAELDQGPERD